MLSLPRGEGKACYVPMARKQPALPVGKQIRKLRQEHGWTREEAAERAGIALDTLGRFEREDHMPSLPVALRLAEVFGVTVEELATGAAAEGKIRPVEAQAVRWIRRLDEHHLVAVNALLRHLADRRR